MHTKFKLFDRNTAVPQDSNGLTHPLVLEPDFVANRLDGIQQLTGLAVHYGEGYETVKLEAHYTSVPLCGDRMKLASSSIYVLSNKQFILVDATSRVALFDRSHYVRIAHWFQADCPAFYLVRRGRGGSVLDFMPVADVLALQGDSAQELEGRVPPLKPSPSDYVA